MISRQWIFILAELTFLFASIASPNLLCFDKNAGKFALYVSPNHIFLSSDSGLHWNSLDILDGSEAFISISCNDYANTAYILSRSNIYRLLQNSTNNYEFGVVLQSPEGREWNSLALDSSGARVVASCGLTCLFSSTDYGISWAPLVYSSSSSMSFLSLSSSSSGQYLAMTSMDNSKPYNQKLQISMSSNFGVSWIETIIDYNQYSPITSTAMDKLGRYVTVSSDYFIYTSQYYGYIFDTYRSSLSSLIVTMDSTGQYQIAAPLYQFPAQALFSSTFGTNWMSIYIDQSYFSLRGLTLVNKRIVIGIDGPVLISDNMGISWSSHAVYCPKGMSASSSGYCDTMCCPSYKRYCTIYNSEGYSYCSICPLGEYSKHGDRSCKNECSFPSTIRLLPPHNTDEKDGISHCPAINFDTPLFLQTLIGLLLLLPYLITVFWLFNKIHGKQKESLSNLTNEDNNNHYGNSAFLLLCRVIVATAAFPIEFTINCIFLFSVLLANTVIFSSLAITLLVLPMITCLSYFYLVYSRREYLHSTLIRFKPKFWLVPIPSYTWTVVGDEIDNPLKFVIIFLFSAPSLLLNIALFAMRIIGLIYFSATQLFVFQLWREGWLFLWSGISAEEAPAPVEVRDYIVDAGQYNENSLLLTVVHSIPWIILQIVNLSYIPLQPSSVHSNRLAIGSLAISILVAINSLYRIVFFNIMKGYRIRQTPTVLQRLANTSSDDDASYDGVEDFAFSSIRSSVEDFISRNSLQLVADTFQRFVSRIVVVAGAASDAAVRAWMSNHESNERANHDRSSLRGDIQMNTSTLQEDQRRSGRYDRQIKRERLENQINNMKSAMSSMSRQMQDIEETLSFLHQTDEEESRDNQEEEIEASVEVNPQSTIEDR